MKKLKKYISLMAVLMILVLFYIYNGIRVMSSKYDITNLETPWWHQYNNFTIEISPENIKRKIVVAIIDTGVSHESFPYPNIIEGYNAVKGNTDTTDKHGHGKVLAHLIASPKLGINPYAVILPVKVRNTMFDWPEIVSEGIKWAADHDADIINLSIGRGPKGIKLYEGYFEGVEYALDKGKLLIASTGSNGTSMFYPAAIEGVISVGGLDKDLNYKYNIAVEDIDIFAVDTKDEASASFPTAIVSGAVSLLMALDEDLTSRQAMDVILAQADNIYINGKSAKVLNLDRAIEYLSVKEEINEKEDSFGNYYKHFYAYSM